MGSSTQHPVVCYGEVLWDLLPGKALPGGAPMNVAYHLKKLGAQPTLLTKIGDDDYGKRLLDLFASSGLNTAFVQVDDQQPTGLVYAQPNEKNEVVYDIAYPAAWDFIEWREAFTPLVQAADVFVYGSLAARNNVSRETLYRLLEIAPTKILDINLRPPHFNQSTLEYLLNKADIVKMNESEVVLLSDWYGTMHNLEDRTKLLLDRFNLSTIIVTLGEAGALINTANTIYRHAGYSVTVADTIGSGDSFLAGFIHHLLNGSSTEETLAFACGIGAFMATQHGACPPYELRQVEELMASKTSVP